jgi:hypothetical protein
MKKGRKRIFIALLILGAIAGIITWIVLASKGKGGSSGNGGNTGGGGNHPPPHGNPPSGAEAQKFLGMHNYYRQRSGLSPLSWSSELANAAQAWSEYLVSTGCAFHHPGLTESEQPCNSELCQENCRKYLNATNGCQHGGWGQNLTKASGSYANPCGVVQGWYAECPQFTGGFSPAAGHYSQVMWPEAKEVGCGVATCDGASIYTCTYDQGNIMGEFGGVPKACKSSACPSSCPC